MESRRNVIRAVAASAVSAVATAAAQRPKTGNPSGPLTEAAKIDVRGDGAAIIGRAEALGRQYHKQYGNCAQCAIAALQDAMPFAPDSGLIFLAGSCLHGGATKTGNANCGAFTGGGIVIGCLCGRPRERFADRNAGALSARLMNEVAARFEQTYGSVLCRDVRAKVGGSCSEVVGRAAGWTTEAILKQFAKT